MPEVSTNIEATEKTEADVLGEECLAALNKLGILPSPSSRKNNTHRSLNETALSAAMALMRTLPIDQITQEVVGKQTVEARGPQPTELVDIINEIKSTRELLSVFMSPRDKKPIIDKPPTIGDVLAVSRSLSLPDLDGHAQTLADHYVDKSPAALSLLHKIQDLPPKAPAK